MQCVRELLASVIGVLVWRHDIVLGTASGHGWCAWLSSAGGFCDEPSNAFALKAIELGFSLGDLMARGIVAFHVAARLHKLRGVSLKRCFRKLAVFKS